MSDTFRLSLPRVPSGEAIRHADEAMALSDARLCPFCGEDAIDEEGFCQSEECQA